MGLIGSLFKAVFFAAAASRRSGRGGKVHYHKSKIDKVEDWKDRKHARGEWLPHDEYVRRKRGK